MRMFSPLLLAVLATLLPAAPPAAVVHGGAGSPRARMDGTDKAAAKAFERLKTGASALDAALAGVVVLEDDPRFNAGTGANIRLDGKTIQMDSACMDGTTGDFGSVAAIDTVTIAPNGAGANTVRATIARNETRIFSELFTSQPLTITVTATAALSTATNACILALDPTASAAINFSGNTSTTFTNCVVMSNSISSSSVNVQGSAQATMPCAYAVGGATTTNGLTLTSCGGVQTYQSPVGDPFASLAIPTATGPCLNGNGGNLSPGRYCSGLSFKNHVTLQPGTYIIDGGSISANANANVSGVGVTLIFLNGATLSLNGNGVFNVSAPTTGTYAGFLLVGGRTNTGAITVNGDSTSQMTGNIYFSNQSVSYLGNYSGTNGCTHIVAKTVQWTGSTTVSVDCSAQGLLPIPVGGVTLIG